MELSAKRKRCDDHKYLPEKRSRLELTAELIRSAALNKTLHPKQPLLQLALARITSQDLQSVHAQAEAKSLLIKGNSLVEQLPLALLDHLLQFLDCSDSEPFVALSKTLAGSTRHGRGL